MKADMRQRQSNLLNPCIGLVERDGKIYFGIQYLNPCINILSTKIQETFGTTSVIIMLELKSCYNRDFYEDNIVKLENSGDLDLIVWGEKLRNFFKIYPQVIFKLLLEALR